MRSLVSYCILPTIVPCRPLAAGRRRAPAPRRPAPPRRPRSPGGETPWKTPHIRFRLRTARTAAPRAAARSPRVHSSGSDGPPGVRGVHMVRGSGRIPVGRRDGRGGPVRGRGSHPGRTYRTWAVTSCVRCGFDRGGRGERRLLAQPQQLLVRGRRTADRALQRQAGGARYPSAMGDPPVTPRAPVRPRRRTGARPCMPTQKLRTRGSPGEHGWFGDTSCTGIGPSPYARGAYFVTCGVCGASAPWSQ